jgi:AcrR family transcriptional regulator
MMTTPDAAEPSTSSWREQAVARRLDPARARAEERVQRFLDAAMELMNDSPSGVEFTVQEVVEKSGQSLRSFYQYFGGKQELMLALFEEAVLSTTEKLRALVAQEDTALERLHVFVVEYYKICRMARKRRVTKARATPAMAQFAQQLLSAPPAEAARVFAPLVAMFEQVLAEAADEKAVRSDIPRHRVAGVVLDAIMFNAFSRTIVAEREVEDGAAAEELFDLVFQGIGTGRA